MWVILISISCVDSKNYGHINVTICLVHAQKNLTQTYWSPSNFRFYFYFYWLKVSILTLNLTLSCIWQISSSSGLGILWGHGIRGLATQHNTSCFGSGTSLIIFPSIICYPLFKWFYCSVPPRPYTENPHGKRPLVEHDICQAKCCQ